MPPLLLRLFRQPAVAIFLFIFCVYAFFARGNLGLDGQVRYEVASSMVRGEGFSAGDFNGIPWTSNGHTINYGVFGIGQSVLLAPVAAAFSLLDKPLDSDIADANVYSDPTHPASRRAAYALLSIIFFPALAAGAIVMIYGLVREAGISIAVSARFALMAAFATPVLIYAGDGQEVSQITALLAAGAWLTLKATRAPARFAAQLLLAAGACFWLMPVFRTQNLLEAAVFSTWAILTFYSSRPHTRITGRTVQCTIPTLAFAIPAAASLGWLLLFNLLRFGSLTADPYNLIFRHRDIDPFSHPFWRGLLGPIISPDKGILWFCPVLFIALIAAARRIPVPRPLSQLSLLAAMCFLITAAALARYISWGGDHAIGPRLEMHLVPFMLLPAVALLNRQAVATWVKLAIAISIIVQLAGKALDPALEIYQYPRASNVTPELSPRHGPGRFINRFSNLGKKATGQLIPQWETAIHRSLTPQEQAVTGWDVFWVRAWKSGQTAGIAMSIIAALLASAAAASAKCIRPIIITPKKAN